MADNAVLEAIASRRSVIRFRDEQVSDEQLTSILEAGRWAPSFANAQPWTFVVVKESDTKRRLVEIVERVTIARQGVIDAPLLVAVVVDPIKDPRHFVEAGAAAAQNMALAAHSLGLASYWVGVYDPSGRRNTAEAKMKKVLGIPREFRLIALLPVGVPAQTPDKKREVLRDLVRYEKFA